MNQDQDELVPVSKGADYLEVHPTALSNHLSLGWSKCQRRLPKVEKPNAKPSDGLNVEELKDALTAKAIAIPEGAKKPDLQA
jgi:hypothetical protein